MSYHISQSALARKNLDRRLQRLRPVEELARPARGWLKPVRDALGMTTAQLAARIGVSQPRIIALEKGEANDSLTLASLRQAAAGLGCTLVYALVPSKPLDTILRERASVIADRQLARTHHSMTLENQAVEVEDLRAERERQIDQLLQGNIHRLWDTP